MTDTDDLEQRIHQRAYRIWQEQGEPEGRAEEHWEQAKLLVSIEDGHHSTLQPVQAPQPEPIEAVNNQAEFPTLTDQGEQQIPHRPGPNG